MTTLVIARIKIGNLLVRWVGFVGRHYADIHGGYTHSSLEATGSVIAAFSYR